MSFKLPDFLSWGLLNTMRKKMGAPLAKPFVMSHQHTTLEIPIIEQLNSGGVEVDFDEISVHDDGTLLYRGYRGLLHIRDINDDAKMPKYHLAYCITLETMRGKSRLNRYVVAQTVSGEFRINIIDKTIISKKVRLDVCQNCLDRIRWKGFSKLDMSSNERHHRVKDFSLADFFKEYPRDLIGLKPSHTADTAPLNDYPENWAQLSKEIRVFRGLQCEACRKRVSSSDLRFLHVHHINGLKYDNRNENLKVLCIACHAEQPLHGHLKSHPDYKIFMDLHQR